MVYTTRSVAISSWWWGVAVVVVAVTTTTTTITTVSAFISSPQQQQQRNYGWVGRQSGATIPAMRVATSKSSSSAWWPSSSDRSRTRTSPQQQGWCLITANGSRCCTYGRTFLCMAATSGSNNDDDDYHDFESNDPFIILGMKEPSTDMKVIKRAYKRRALKFHPDVVTTQQSTPQQKKDASDRFAKINWAYQTLSGKRDSGDATYGKAPSTGRRGATTTTSGSSTSGGWTPPHRRSSGTSTSSSTDSRWPDSSTDWRDYMPKSDNYDEQYDTGGDSFEKIFSDLFAGAAVGAAGVAGTGANLFLDFIEFLEGTVDGYGPGGTGTGRGSSSGSDQYDAELLVLLRTGSIEDVANEMDDTSLVVEQLQSKARHVEDEILTTTAEMKMTSRYRDKIELEQRLAELSARKDIVNGYLKKAQRRLLSLQTRYKELITYGGVNDSYVGGRGGGGTGSSSYSQRRGSSDTGGQSGPTSASSGHPPPTSSYSSRTSTASGQSTKGGDNDEDSWMHEGFGSSSGRGSGRRRTRRSSTDTATTTTSSSPYPPDYNSAPGRDSSSFGNRETVRPSPRSTSTTTTSSVSGDGSSGSSRTNTNNMIPPHRRASSSSYESMQEEDQRRMRELKVDEEFDKLKKELGL